MEFSHTPVLLAPVLSFLGRVEGERPADSGEDAIGADAGGADALLVDATLGEGGHSAALLAAWPGLRLIGVEADAGILAIARGRLERFGERVQTWEGWFDDFFAEFPRHSGKAPDRILFDLGISMYHYTRSGRGFSFAREEPLDMRLRGGEGPTAADLVNENPLDELEELIRGYGEERLARMIARKIGQEREREPIRDSRRLAEVVWRAVPPAYRHGRIHPATRTFQALRIAVNDELGRLQRGLAAAFEALAPGGRLGVITFHSLEDRIVKQFLRGKNRSCTCPPELPECRCGGKREAFLLTTKPVSADEEEKRDNPASRSAHLRVARKAAA